MPSKKKKAKKKTKKVGKIQKIVKLLDKIEELHEVLEDFGLESASMWRADAPADMVKQIREYFTGLLGDDWQSIGKPEPKPTKTPVK